MFPVLICVCCANHALTEKLSCKDAEQLYKKINQLDQISQVSLRFVSRDSKSWTTEFFQGRALFRSKKGTTLSASACINGNHKSLEDLTAFLISLSSITCPCNLYGKLNIISNICTLLLLALFVTLIHVFESQVELQEWQADLNWLMLQKLQRSYIKCVIYSF